MTGGEALNPDVREKWKSHVGLELHEGYGQSETVSASGARVPGTGHLYPSPQPLGGDDQLSEPLPSRLPHLSGTALSPGRS